MFTPKFIKKHNIKARKQRTSKISKDIAFLLSDVKTFLDVGAFDGMMTKKIMQGNNKLKGKGIDILVPKKTYVPVKKYNGKKIPYPDKSFDAILLIDVVHHAENPDALLKEAARVAKKYVIIKDHYYKGFIDKMILSAVDFIGNESFNIKVKFHFFKIDEWKNILRKNKLKIVNYPIEYNQKKKDIIGHVLIKVLKVKK
ncbi:MAG: class I SAM-dependent methyltransferase [Nanoarchaeota archaeon]|nr:class I SAM-dependent methyltransferase [Nanoarchaeota archaeon]MBU1321078.1 class I SAM-dependent methyltransferase [Nanoarchaeota archaeon]MBU1597083.1 class I SAM-dependent methyltransferase [Nanoarchaeota archaeon]